MQVENNAYILNSLINRYQKKIFALVLYLTGNNPDKAYEITVTSFVEALSGGTHLRDESVFLAGLAKNAVEKCRDVKVILSSEDPYYLNIPPAKVQSYKILREALQALPFDQKVMLLMRDQIHLPFKTISSVLERLQKDMAPTVTMAQIKNQKSADDARNKRKVNLVTHKKHDLLVKW